MIGLGLTEMSCAAVLVQLSCSSIVQIMHMLSSCLHELITKTNNNKHRDDLII